MPRTKWRNDAIVDAINLVLGAFLFLAPWIFAFSSDAARQSAWYAGFVIAFVAFMELVEFAEWTEWVNLTVGIWVVASIWALGLYAETTAMWVHLIVGLVVAILAAIELWLAHRRPPRRRAAV
jgi:hypothetical protein